MELINDLKKVYRAKYFTLSAGGSLQLNETDRQSELKEVEILGFPQKALIDKSLLDCMREAYLRNEDESVMELDHVCDGIIAAEDENHEKYLFYIELKTSCKPTNICKAQKQLRATYLKFSSILYSFEKADLSNYKVICLLVAPPLSVEQRINYEEKASKDRREGKEMSSARLTINLHSGKILPIDFTENERVALPYRQELYVQSLPFLYVSCQNGGHIDLMEVCRRIKCLER